MKNKRLISGIVLTIIVVIIVIMITTSTAKAKNIANSYPPYYPPYYPPNTNPNPNQANNTNTEVSTAPPNKYAQIAAAIKFMYAHSAVCPVAYGKDANYWFAEIDKLGVLELDSLLYAWNQIANESQDVNISGGVKGGANGVEISGGAGTTWQINQTATLHQALSSFWCNSWYTLNSVCLDCDLRSRVLAKIPN